MFVPYGIPKGSSMTCLKAICLADRGEVQGVYGVDCGKAWPMGPAKEEAKAAAQECGNEDAVLRAKTC